MFSNVKPLPLLSFTARDRDICPSSPLKATTSTAAPSRSPGSRAGRRRKLYGPWVSGASGVATSRQKNTPASKKKRTQRPSSTRAKRRFNFRCELALELILQTNELREYRALESLLKCFLDSHGR